MKGNAPKLPRTGFQSVEVKNPQPNSRKLSFEETSICSAIAPMVTTIRMANPAVMILKARSPQFTCDEARPSGKGPSAEGWSSVDREDMELTDP